MDDWEVDFADDQMFSCLDVPNFESTCSLDMDEFVDRTQACNDGLGRTEAYTDVLGRTQACTHAHACNPFGPDKSHTHTCIHVHTQIMPSHAEPQAPSDETAELVDKKSKKKPLGNREAVRKYREKKKARSASLEDEVVKLRAINQQLMKRLQSQALLEAEVARLKCLLVDIRGRIEGEVGSFAYQNQSKGVDLYENIADPTNVPGTYMMNPCNMQSNDPLYCLRHGSDAAAFHDQETGDCGFDIVQCSGRQSSSLKGLLDSPSPNVTLPTRRRGSCKSMAL